MHISLLQHGLDLGVYMLSVLMHDLCMLAVLTHDLYHVIALSRWCTVVFNKIVISVCACGYRVLFGSYMSYY